MHPVLFTIGKIPIYSYGVMLGTSLIVAWYLIMWLGVKKDDLRRDLMANAFFVTAVFALLGSRVLYIVTNPDEFDTPVSWFQFRTGGLVAYGGFLGGFFASLWYWRRKNVPLTAWADVVLPTLGTGLFFTRIGCYLYGCDFGQPLEADAPSFLRDWGTFPKWSLDHLDIHGSPAWSHHVEQNLIENGARYSRPVHPTQLYESAIGLVLFGICMLVMLRRQFRGQVLCVGAIAYGLWRFGVEFLRDDPERGALAGFSTSQWISLAIVPAAVIAYVMLHKRHQELGGDPPIPPDARESEHLKASEKKPAEKGGTKKKKVKPSAKK